MSDPRVRTISAVPSDVPAAAWMTDHVPVALDGGDESTWLRLALERSYSGTFDVHLAAEVPPIVTEAAKRLFGFPAGAVPGLGEYVQRVHEDDRARVLAAVQDVVERGIESLIDFRVAHPDGRVARLVARTDVVRGADGRVERLLGTLIDAGARHASTESSRELTLRLGLALDAAYLVAFEWDIERNEVRRFHSTNPVLSSTPVNAPSTLEAVIEAVHPEDREHFTAKLRAALEDPAGHYENEFRIRQPDGEIVWLLDRGRVEHDAAGRPTRLVGLSRDISARRLAEEQHRESESTLRSFYESSPLLMGVVELSGDDTDILHVYDSPACDRFFGRAPGLTRGKYATELGAPADAIRLWLRHYRESERERHPVRFEYAHVTPAGTRWLSAIVSWIGPAGAGRTRFSYVVEDITARHVAEEQLRESERRFRQMADHAPVMMRITEPDGRCTFLNRPWHEFTGQDTADAEGFGWLDAVHPADRPMAERAFREANAARGTFRLEYRLRHRDGAYRWCIDAAAPRHAEDGTFLGYIGSVVDVHEQREAQLQLEASYAELEAVYRAVPVGLCVLDRDLRFLRINERLAEMNGHPPEAHVGRTVREMVPDLGGQAASAFERVFETGEPVYDLEVVGETPARPGVRRTWLEQWLPVRDTEGGVIGISVVAEEITERLRADSERTRLLEAERAARAAADEANRAKVEFLANMSHELRTPLNAIAGHVELVEMGLHGPVTPAQRDALARVQRAQRHLLSLINDVLNFARLDAGRVQLDMQPLSLADVVADVGAMIGPQLAARGLVFEDLLAAPAPIVWGDREKLAQVMLNLLSNAVKFTSPVRDDGTAGRITIDAVAHGESEALIALRVHDTGIGISPGKQEEIFEPFVQLRAGLTRPHEGTGLGLSISRDLARMMGGDILVHSVEGKGSVFSVVLRRTES